MPSVLLTHSPTKVLQYLLVNLGAGILPESQALPTDWLIFASQQPNEPDDIVVLADIGGFKKGRVQISGEVQEHYGIDLLVRGIRLQTTPGYDRVFNKMKSVCQIFDQQVRNSSVTVEGTTYTVHNMTRTGSVIPLGQDRASNQRFIFTTSYLASIVEET